jgi:glycopeptide antibiotics resistance protein
LREQGGLVSDFMLELAATVLPATAIGAAVVWLAYSTASRRSGAAAARLAAARALLAVVVAVLLVWTLLLSNPDAVDARALNLVPFREISRALVSKEAGYGVVNLWGNVLVFVPVGMLALLSMRGTVRWAGTKALTAGIALSVTIEAAQYTVGRSADIDDVILNTLGIALGVAGVALARGLERRRPAPIEDPA